LFFAGIIHFPSISLQFLLRQLTADFLRNSLRPLLEDKRALDFSNLRWRSARSSAIRMELSTSLGQRPFV